MPQTGGPNKEGIVDAFLVLLKRVQSDIRLEYAVLDPATVEIAYNIAKDFAEGERGTFGARRFPGDPLLAWIAQPKRPKNTIATPQAADQTNRRNLDE
jgi:hypothetical protein